VSSLNPVPATFRIHFLRLAIGASLILVIGCGDGRPRNPAVEVIENPPTELSQKFAGASIRLANQSLDDRTRVKKGESIRVSVDLKQTLPLSGVAMIHIRVNPKGQSESSWRSFSFADEYVGPINSDGTGQIDAVVRAPLGLYDVRCYVLIHPVTEDIPEFHLIRRGVLEVSAPSEAR
jgi:hypothetical protein